MTQLSNSGLCLSKCLNFTRSCLRMTDLNCLRVSLAILCIQYLVTSVFDFKVTKRCKMLIQLLYSNNIHISNFEVCQMVSAALMSSFDKHFIMFIFQVESFSLPQEKSGMSFLVIKSKRSFKGCLLSLMDTKRSIKKSAKNTFN